MRNRNGFTIVELMVVIVVVGILCAITIPTVVSAIDDANLVADEALVKRINEILIVHKATQKLPQTSPEIINVLEMYGLNDIKAKAKNYCIVFNRKTNQVENARVTDIKNITNNRIALANNELFLIEPEQVDANSFSIETIGERAKITKLFREATDSFSFNCTNKSLTNFYKMALIVTNNNIFPADKNSDINKIEECILVLHKNFTSGEFLLNYEFPLNVKEIYIPVMYESVLASLRTQHQSDSKNNNDLTIILPNEKYSQAVFERDEPFLNIHFTEINTTKLLGHKLNVVPQVGISSVDVGKSGEEYGVYLENTYITLSAIIEEGYEFSGWYINKEKLSNQETFDFKMNGFDCEIEAKSEAKEYELTVIRNGESKTIKHKYKEHIDLSAPKINGFSFVGWYNGNNELSKETNYSITMPAQNFKIEAKYEKNPVFYTLIVHAENGVVYFENDIITDKDIKEGRSVTLKAEENEGYIFSKWEISNEVKSTEATYIFTMEEDIEITAVFVKAEYNYKLVYMSKDGNKRVPLEITSGNDFYSYELKKKNYIFNCSIYVEEYIGENNVVGYYGDGNISSRGKSHNEIRDAFILSDDSNKKIKFSPSGNDNFSFYYLEIVSTNCKWAYPSNAKCTCNECEKGYFYYYDMLDNVDNKVYLESSSIKYEMQRIGNSAIYYCKWSEIRENINCIIGYEKDGQVFFEKGIANFNNLSNSIVLRYLSESDEGNEKTVHFEKEDEAGKITKGVSAFSKIKKCNRWIYAKKNSY